MTNDTEWGPWIEHAGGGFPSGVKFGELVHRVMNAACISAGYPCSGRSQEWVEPLREVEEGNWYAVATPHVIRYRIRKPRGIEDMLANPATFEIVDRPDPVCVPERAK